MSKRVGFLSKVEPLTVFELVHKMKKAIRRLFNLSKRTHSRFLHVICNNAPINVQLYKKFNKFIQTTLNTANDCVKLVGKLAACGSQSTLSKT